MKAAFKNYLWRYGVFVAGLYFLTLGIVFILRSTLGTTPISSLSYVLSVNLPPSLGTCTFLINVLLILGQFWFVRHDCDRTTALEILMQAPFSLLFGCFIDLNMYCTAGVAPGNYLQSLLLLLFGCTMQAAGIVLEIKPRVVMMPGEGFVHYASRHFHREFGRVKIWFDLALVISAAVVSLLFVGRIEGIREGTVISACSTGLLVSFLGRYVIVRRHADKLRHVFR